MARRQHLLLTIVFGLCVFFSISFLFSTGPASPRSVGEFPKGKSAIPLSKDSVSSEGSFKVELDSLPTGILEGESIAPKLENATLKAELGRATWKFLHTMAARFPEKPTAEERTTLETFIHLFGRLYPCGDCARHFRELLAEYPPQTGSRNSAAGWLCFAHNQVNERLDKPIFDCNKIGDFYDCGCGDEKKEGKDSEKELDS